VEGAGGEEGVCKDDQGLGRLLRGVWSISIGLHVGWVCCGSLVCSGGWHIRSIRIAWRYSYCNEQQGRVGNIISLDVVHFAESRPVFSSATK
jgi:hypothetical protein